MALSALERGHPHWFMVCVGGEGEGASPWLLRTNQNTTGA